jgi:hypothetical protein
MRRDTHNGWEPRDDVWCGSIRRPSAQPRVRSTSDATRDACTPSAVVILLCAGGCTTAARQRPPPQGRLTVGVTASGASASTQYEPDSERAIGSSLPDIGSSQDGYPFARWCGARISGDRRTGYC